MKKILSCLFAIVALIGLAACSSDEISESKGYLKLEVNTLVSTNNRAGVPDGYNGKTLHVAIINSAGQTVLQTDDVANDAAFKGNILLDPGTYTITATSAKWDGSDSGFNAPYYTGTTTATVAAKTLTQAAITLTQANVKVTVNYDASFKTYFSEAQTVVTSKMNGVAAQYFRMGQTTGSAYFPVADLKFLLNVTNLKGASFSQNNEVTNVKARDHFIINYKVAEAGSVGGVHVYIDDATNAYNYTIEVPRKSSTALQAFAANAWSTSATLRCAVTAKTSSFTTNNLKLQWKQASAGSWTDVPATSLTSLGNDEFSYELRNLTPNSNYVYRLNYNDGQAEVNSNEVAFTTEQLLGIYNSGFENWYNDGSIAIAGNKGDAKYWNTSNAGAANFIGSVTTKDTDLKHSGSASARLATKYAVIKLAAASIFTGDFIGLIGTNGAKLLWGVPFTSRPSALTGYYVYNPGKINRGKQPSGVGAPASGANDECQIFCALTTEAFKVANASNNDGYELSTAINWQTDPRVVAYGELTRSTSTSGWEKFNIPLVYHTTTVKPTHMIIVCSSSKYGDYFYGSDSSVLNLDDFEFEYGTPTVK